ncbi:MAG: hypothetical protein GY719_32330 [bacterium]|nr:hypothetical protein [bacterium]
MNFLTYPWVIGVGGSLISALVVGLLSRAIIGRRANREYAQLVSMANRDLMNALRPMVAEKQLPSPPVLDSLVAASAERHEVKKEDMLSPERIASTLIRDIMSNNFLSADQKREFCELALAIREQSAGHSPGPSNFAFRGLDTGAFAGSLQGATTFFIMLMAFLFIPAQGWEFWFAAKSQAEYQQGMRLLLFFLFAVGGATLATLTLQYIRERKKLQAGLIRSQRHEREHSLTEDPGASGLVPRREPREGPSSSLAERGQQDHDRKQVNASGDLEHG